MKASSIQVECPKCGSMRQVFGEGTPAKVKKDWLKHSQCGACETVTSAQTTA